MAASKSRVGLVMITALAVLPFTVRDAAATEVEFQTVLGNFRVNLYDNITPGTVENFLEYVNNGAYTNSVIHRSDPGFVIQGGGYTFDLELPLEEIPRNPSVRNEPELANVRGTIGMARLNNRPNSATSQWFFNLDDNSDSLDWPRGGYTVFGEVVDDGMDVVDAIAALPVFDLGDPVNSAPLRDYTDDDLLNGAVIDEDNLVIITAVIVTDSTVDSAAGLDPPLNTATNRRPPPLYVDSGSGGPGSTSLLFLLAIGLVRLLARRRIARSAAHG